jgi:hypothetical protein
MIRGGDLESAPVSGVRPWAQFAVQSPAAIIPERPWCEREVAADRSALPYEEQATRENPSRLSMPTGAAASSLVRE